MLDDFMVRAALAGMAVAVVAGPLGVFVVWRRMAYFGGALSHTALLGVALGFLLGIQPIFGVFVVVGVVALILGRMNTHSGLSLDTLLGVVAHGALAVGLIVIGILDGVRIDLMSYLFGDILAVSRGDVMLVWAGAIVVFVALLKIWRPLLTVTVHADLAAVEGIHVPRVELAFMVLLAIVVALAMKVVGILLVTSLLIVPAATVRTFAKTPESMAVLAAFAGVMAVGGGLWVSLQFDSPTGPSIVAVSALLFVFSLFKKQAF